MRRNAVLVTVLTVGVAACAQGQLPAEEPDAVPPHIDADLPDARSSGRVDAEPGAPDAAPKPDSALADATPPPPDAMPPPPDAMPRPDAAPGTPDAMPLPPDAAPACTTMILGLLTNGGFDTGVASPWSESSAGGYELVTATADLPVAPQSGGYATWMGGYFSGNDQLYQSVAIPADATDVHVKGYRWFATEETGGTWDYFYVKLRNSAGTPLTTLATMSNADTTSAWTPFDYDAGATYAGQTIQVYFQATTDGSLNTNFFLDTVAVEAVVCR